ncbi:hypothetical protein K449DRAFT_439855 [Hypoxylon sp. EC38]|nr:hypothetical protein K449DRAFT_439855 [Hypoxylon sp. EC38]
MATNSEATMTAARPKAKASLDSFAVELLNDILLSLHSPLELSSIIHASSVFYRVFKRSRVLILAQVIRNAFGEALPDALGAFYALRHEWPSSESNDEWDNTNRWMPGLTPQSEALRRFMELYSSRNLKFPHDFKDLACLSRIWLQTDYFVSDYSNRAILLMRGEEPARLPVWAYPSEPKLRDRVPISTVETARLQRAFLRFDMFCTCSRPLELASGTRVALWQFCGPDDEFIRGFHKLEVEELRCVYQYLTQLIMLLFGDIEDALCRDVEGADSLSAPPDTSSAFPMLEVIHPIGSDLFSDKGKSRFDLCIANVCSKGIQFVHHLLCGDEDTRRLEILRTCRPMPSLIWQTLATVDLKTLESLRGLITVANESIPTYNLGRLQVEGVVGRCWPLPKTRFSLRDRGYVFWDASRLTDMKWENHKYLYTYLRKTAEERLKNVEISRHRHHEIDKKYEGYKYQCSLEYDDYYDSRLRYLRHCERVNTMLILSAGGSL